MLFLSEVVTYVITGIAGKSDSDQAQVDMIADCIGDAKKPIVEVFFEKDEEKKVSDFQSTVTQLPFRHIN